MKDEFENEQIYDESIEENLKNTSKSRKKGIIVGALIGLIIGIVFLLMFSSYRILLSPKKANFLTYFTTDISELKNISQKIIKNNIVSFFTDGNNKHVDFDIYSNSKELSGDTLINKEFFALNFKNINENYLLLENKELDKFWTKLGLEDYELPSEINFENISLSLTKGEQRKIYNFVEKCIYNIIDNLENDNFILTSEKTLEVNEENRILKSIEVQFSETDLLMLQKEILVALDKEGILNLLINKVNNFGNSDTVSKKELKEELEKYIAYLDYAKAYSELQDKGNEYYIVYRIYSDGKNIIARELTEKYKYEGTLYEDIIARLITMNDEFYELRTFSQEDYSSAYYNIISDVIDNQDNKQIHNITYKVEGFYVEYLEENYEYVPLDSSVSYSIIVEKNEDEVNKIYLLDENNMYNFNLQYNNMGISTEFINNKNNFKIKIAVKNDNINKEDLLNNGAILINEKTQEELISLVSNIGTAITELKLFE